MSTNSGHREELAGRRDRDKRVGLHVAPSGRKIQPCWSSSASSVGSISFPIFFSISSFSRSYGSFLSLSRSHCCWHFEEFLFSGDGIRGRASLFLSSEQS